jgi:hypothetical protein
MSSRTSTPLELDSITSQASASNSQTSLPNAFGRMMSSSQPALHIVVKDKCNRPEPTYNHNYDPDKVPRDDLPGGYSPYIFGEPLYDDRPVVMSRLPSRHTVAGAAKRDRTQWVWALGYAFENNTKSKPSLVWACKHCHHDTAFSRKIDFHFAANSLKNAEKHLQNVHQLDQGGDIWRKRSARTAPQVSSFTEGSYERIIPFRQLEFKNAFLEWIIMDDVKLRKAASKRLRRAFRIANKQCINALPRSSTTTASWIEEMYTYFEPVVIEELKQARSKISISFDGWGSKHEKISLVGVVTHFINSKGHAVSRLIGMPELPGHGKSGKGI